MYEKTHYVGVAIITLLVFTLGVFIGNMIADYKVEFARDLNTQLTLESKGLELKYAIAGEDICENFEPNELFDELYDIGAKLDHLENAQGTSEQELDYLKEFYQILEIENWLLIRDYQEQCESEAEYILYFYSNEGDCPDCEQQGHALTFLRQTEPNVYVFSFDINNQNPGIEMLRDKFEVRVSPSLVIKDQAWSGLRTADDIMEILNA